MSIYYPFYITKIITWLIIHYHQISYPLPDWLYDNKCLYSTPKPVSVVLTILLYILNCPIPSGQSSFWACPTTFLTLVPLSMTSYPSLPSCLIFCHNNNGYMLPSFLLLSSPLLPSHCRPLPIVPSHLTDVCNILSVNSLYIIICITSILSFFVTLFLHTIMQLSASNFFSNSKPYIHIHLYNFQP